MKIGIVGLPNAGKSTLFNALTHAGAEAAAYPFTTLEPNQAVVPVPDDRLDRLAVALGAHPVVHDTITFVDIAGLVRGAHRGEGLGNQFLANIRETDAIVHVVRAFEDGRVAHPHGRIDPLDDIDAIETELILADLAQAERRLERVAKQAKSGDREPVAEAGWLSELIAALDAGNPATAVPSPADQPDFQQRLFSLTAKPVLYVANVSDDVTDADVVRAAPRVAERAAERGAVAVAVSARLEAELGEMEEAEAEEMRQDFGVQVNGLERVVRGAFDLLQLIAFITGARDKEARAWSIRRGSTAQEAAGRIHTDLQRGFVRAEIAPWADLAAAGSWSALREAGKLRIEGREYVMCDGDAITVKFTP